MRLNLLLLLLVLVVVVSCKKEDSESLYTVEMEIMKGSIPDFSYVGYMRGEKAIPSPKVDITISPIEGDNFQHIQDAIDSIGKMQLINGHRGVLLLKKGLYEVSQSLIINKSGIIIRGEGQGINGTHINSTYQFKNKPKTSTLRTLAVIYVSGNNYSVKESGLKTSINKEIPMGSTSIAVENTDGFHKGDTIQITKTTNEQWVRLLGMIDYGWQSSSFQIPHERIIKDVLSNTLEIDVPMVDAIETKYGGGSVQVINYEGRINNIGIENMRVTTDYMNDEDEDHLWSAVSIIGAHNSWVKNITAEHFAFAAVGLYRSDNITVQDCAISNFKSLPIGDRRYSFYIHSGTGNLFQRCFSDGGRHDFATGAIVSGPNVFLDCVGLNSTSATGPHLRWATGTLYDNIYAGKIQSLKAQNDGTAHGWTGAYNMFWNNKTYVAFIIQNPPIGLNWLIGPVGRIHHLNDSYIASSGNPVTPRSIYIKQLTDRLGSEAVNRITLPSQQGEAPIWNQLTQWKGEGKALNF